MSEKPIVMAGRDPESKKIKVEVTQPKQKQLEQVVTGTVKKPTLGDKVKKVLFSNDGESVKSYLIHDVLLPAVKNTIWEAVTGGMKMSMFGTREPARGISRDRERSYYNYGSRNVYGREPERDMRASATRRESTPLEFDEVVIPERGSAEHVLSVMCELIDQYDVVSVSDFHDLVGISAISTDNNWGWTNLSAAYVSPTRGGFIIKFPRPRAI